MMKIGAASIAGLLIAWTGTTTQAALYTTDEGRAVATLGATRLALNPQPEPPNKNKKNKKPQKVKKDPAGGIPQTPDRGPAPGQGY